MRNKQTAAIGLRINPITRCRAVVATLFSMLVFLCAVGVTEAKSTGDIPEFHLPSFDVDVLGKDMTLPVPVKVVAPSVHKGLAGTEVTMTFNISESGKITFIDDDASYYDNDEFELACLMHRKLRTWKFEPARDKQGNAVAVKVNLPVKVVGKDEISGTQLASISFKQPVIVSVAKK